MGEAVGKVAVVGEQQQPLGVGVEAADREHAGLGRHEVDDRRPAVRVRGPWSPRRAACSAGSRRARAARRRRAVDLDAVALDVDPATEHGDLAVDRDPAVGDQLLAVPPAAEAALGQHLLQSRSAFVLRRTVGGRHRAPQARNVVSSASTTSAPGTNSPSGGRSASESRPSFSRNSGVVPHSTA